MEVLFVAAGTFWLLSAGTIVPRKQKKRHRRNEGMQGGILEEERMFKNKSGSEKRNSLQR